MRNLVKMTLAGMLAFGCTGCSDPKAAFIPRDGRFDNANCRAVASDRAGDAAMSFDDVDVQRQVFRLTYADCIEWHRTH